MDFFCDEPRSTPKPASLEQIPSCELIPEVSIIFPQNKHVGLQKKSPPINVNKMSYGNWKMQNQYMSQAMTKPKGNKENIASYGQSDCNDSVYKASLRKQVRFDSPSNRKEVLKINNENNSGNAKNAPNFNVCNKPFEQIYMANIPNRHLDLSIIESPVLKTQENKTHYPQNDKLCENYSDNKDIDSVLRDYSEKFKLDKKFDYPYQKFRGEYCIDNDNKTRQLECFSSSNGRNYDRITEKTYPISTISDNNQDTTVKELLKVVQQQNEQILLLQKQVALLLQNQANQKQIEQPLNDQERSNTLQDCPNRNMRFEQPQYDQQKHSKGPLSKFAIDVMTSFEVSIRPQQNLNKQNTGAKIQEITEKTSAGICNNKNDCDSILGDIKQQVRKEDYGKQENDLSLTLTGSLPVMERCPSPENSIHVDMQDYSSDSDDESTSSSTDIGWTIYNNVMGQVNNILKKADLNPNTTTDILDNKTLRKVKEATMRHLKNVGINLPVVEEPKIPNCSTETLNSSEYTPTEISFAVKQLLMKYLPDDQLAKITENTNQPKSNIKSNGDNLIKRRPEFSFATVEYMKKYNLLTSDSTPQQQLQTHQNNKVPKILDVTALKQQPKLL